ncbi:DUF2254 family protein [Antarcticimicrobium luteum]|uniref:DUF2254 domain-containing protein n=1 Tax=Antarcticimicrobium luteum TaxID=2547397 RepID=A0A4R5VFG6_9RHOB|nr:DUF2254 domain-containing protein [Antarcticimicrobium luteum]
MILSLKGPVRIGPEPPSSRRPLLRLGAESARAILSAIAGSMITVAVVTFSMTVLTR